jgi:NIPSNAP
MVQKNILQICSAIAIFVLGFWLGRTTLGHAEAKGRIFELRTYTANEGKLGALHARFRNHTTQFFQKHGMSNIGYWTPTDAQLSQNTLVYILAYPSREAAKKSWEAFNNDPEWKKVKEQSEVNGKLVSRVDSVYMEPTDYSPMR